MKTNLGLCLVASFIMATTSAHAETKVSTKGGLKVSNGDYKFQLGGRIMYDYNKSELNGVTDEEEFDIRRARISIKGDIGKDWAFKSVFKLHESGVKDLYIRYKGFGKGAYVTLGNQKMPFSLEEQQSSKDISILERSGITELFTIGRAEGITVGGNIGSNSTYAVGLFLDDDDKEVDAESGFAARYTFAPIKTDTSVVHLGVAYKDVAQDKAIGLEAAAGFGPFHIQAEYFDGENAKNDDLSGYYLQAGYILTGESRPYKGGKFKRVKPKGNAGAWEVVARYEDGDGKHSDIELGKTDATAFTLGLNWYAHENVRFGINYTDGEDNNSTDTGSEFRIRAQLTF